MMMLSAILFAALAILQFSLSLLEGRTTHPPIDVYVHGTYFVVARFHFQILLALASTLFSLIYFAASRWTPRPLNNFLALTHFALAAIGFVLLSLSLLALKSEALAIYSSQSRAPNYWLFLTFYAGALCFLLGCATLAVNCTWATIGAFRSR
jgi:cytochrome c oxidase subunit I